MNWRIYYADGTTFSSADGSWDDAPARGVIAVVRPNPQTGRSVEKGRAFYIMDPDAGEPWAVDWPGLWDYLHRVGSLQAGIPLRDVNLDALARDWGVKFGRSVPNEVYQRIVIAADNDPDFPRRSSADREAVKEA